MIKKVLIILSISVLLVLFFVAEVNKRKTQNWQVNFSGISKNPYGCFVLRSTLEEHPEIDTLLTINGTFHSELPKIKSDKTKTLLVFTNNFDVDSVSLTAIYDFAGKGNNVMVSAYYFPKSFKDSLHFEINFFDFSKLNADYDSVNFVNPAIHYPTNLVFRKAYPSRFSELDTARHLVLGTGKSNSVIFIKIPYKKGAFYIHSQPLLFTNFHILKLHPEYAYHTFSYFKNTTLIWDDYYKPQIARYTGEAGSPFRYFLSQDALRISLYLALFIIAAFFFFEGKRKQRFIPVIAPPENSTVKFVATIARLYQGKPNYKKMAQRKYLYLKEMVYSRYMLRLDENSPDSARIFSEKTGFSLEKIKEVFILCRRIEASISVDAETLITLSRMIDEIYEFEKQK